MEVSTRFGWWGSLTRATTSFAFALALVLVFTLPWRGAIQIEQIGTIGRILGAIVGVVWGISVLFRMDMRMPSWFHVVLGMLVCWSAVSILWTIDPGETVQTTLRYGLVWGILLAIWDLYRSPEDVEYALQAYVLGGFVVIAAVFYNFGIDATSYVNRFAAFGLNPNLIARMLVLGAPLAWYLFFRSRASLLLHPVLRAVNLLYLALAVVAIVLTGSRQGMIGFAITLVYMLWTIVSDAGRGFSSISRPTVLAAVAVIASGIAIAVYFLVEVTSVFTRLLLLPTEVLSGSFGGRGVIWEASFEVMAQRPLLGHGSGTFVPAVEPLFSADRVPVAAHNAVFQLGVELGLIGIAIYTVLLIGVAAVIVTQPTRYRSLWVTVFGVLLVLIAIEGIVANVVKYLLFMFAVSTASIAVDESESDARGVRTVRGWSLSLLNRYRP